MSDQSAEQSMPGAALARAALRHRVRTITDGAVELQQSLDGALVIGAVVDGVAYCQTAEERGLGPLVRWALGNGAQRLVLVAESEVSGVIARRAGLLNLEIDVWSAAGTEVEPATPAPPATVPELPVDHLRYRAIMAAAGARPVDDHGMLVAEVAGLEVARVVEGDQPSGEISGALGNSGSNGNGNGGGDREPAAKNGPRLAVGVGQADRELQDYIHGHLDDDANLRRAIAAVVQHRSPGAAVHPLSRVARQRWLRSILLDDPSLLGLDRLEPVAPLRPRETVLGDEPAAALGPDTVVVCSVGVDLDLLPEAADYRLRDNPEADLVVVVPERDRLLTTGPMADLVPRLRVTSVPAPWQNSR